MKIAWTERFKRAYKRLPPPAQRQDKKAIAKMAGDLRHPSLRVKRIKGTANIWEVRVTRSGRITFEMRRGVVILRNVGEIDQGDLIEVRIAGDSVMLTPKQLFDKSQAYFWTPEWQAAEAGRVERFETVDDLLRDLDE